MKDDERETEWRGRVGGDPAAGGENAMSTGTSQGTQGRILFVDDEANILKSLQRELIDTDFEVVLAGSAAEGLRILETDGVDMVVSDYKMPGMDGIGFLKLVMKQFPGVSRVIMSGFADQCSILKALMSGLASTYITKPWEADHLLEKLSHLFETRRALTKMEILKTINSIEQLPALPETYRKFVRAVETECPSGTLASIITRDIVSTATLLRIANSAYYHLDKDVSVERALSYIGIDAIRQILLFACLPAGMLRDSGRQGHLHDISVHSALVNCAMGELFYIRYGKPLPEHLTSICITHDIGKIIMLEHLPDRYDACIDYMERNRGTSFYDSELALGFTGATHAEIGAYFLDLWGLPQGSIEASLYHHDLGASEGWSRDVLEVCRDADLLAWHIVDNSAPEGEGLPAFLDPYEMKDKVGELIGRLRIKQEHLDRQR